MATTKEEAPKARKMEKEAVDVDEEALAVVFPEDAPFDETSVPRGMWRLLTSDEMAYLNNKFPTKK